MMKKIYKILTFIILISILTGCAENTATIKKDRITVTDDLKRNVEVSYNPERVIALIGSFASVWTLAGGELIATTNNAFSDFDLDLSSNVINLGASSSVSLETILNCKPDLIIASTKTKIDMELKEVFESAGIPSLYFDVSNFSEYLNMLDKCTDITGRKDLYKKNGLDVKKEIEKAKSKVKDKTKKVLYLRASSKSIKVKGSKGSVLGEMLKDLSCINIADINNSLLEELSMEKIIKEDPDFIFIVLQGADEKLLRDNLNKAVLSHPLYKELTAVKEKRVYYMDYKLYNLKPNNRWGEAYSKLSNILYN